MRWSKVLRPSSPSPSSPATLVAGVLCRGPTKEYSCDPERSTRPEHGGLSDPADTGSRAADTPDQRAARPAAPNRKFRPKNISQNSVQRARRLHGGFTRGKCGVWGRKTIWQEVFIKKKRRCVRALQDHRLFKKLLLCALRFTSPESACQHRSWLSDTRALAPNHSHTFPWKMCVEKALELSFLHKKHFN